VTVTYVALNQTKLSALGLYNRLDMMGVKNLNEPEKFHTTIAFSPQDFPADQVKFPEHEFTAIIKEWTLFPSKAEEAEPDMCLVALLECQLLHELHKQCLDLGAVHKFDDYHPHITVSYKFKQNFSLKRLPVDYLVRLSHIPTIEALIQ
jgi:2'-5' RNA ligase